MSAARCLALGADVDVTPTSRPRGRCGARGVGDDLSDRHCPTRQREDDFEPQVGAVNRRHRPSLIQRTSDAESRGVDWKPDAREPCDVRTAVTSGRTSGAPDRWRCCVRSMRAPHAMLQAEGVSKRTPARCEQTTRAIALSNSAEKEGPSLTATTRIRAGRRESPQASPPEARTVS